MRPVAWAKLQAALFQYWDLAASRACDRIPVENKPLSHMDQEEPFLDRSHAIRQQRDLKPSKRNTGQRRFDPGQSGSARSGLIYCGWDRTEMSQPGLPNREAYRET